MPTNLQPITITAPGWKGLNTEQASSILGPEWATDANNCVIDSSGRISSRNGWTKLNATATESGSALESIHEYIDSSGTSTIIWAQQRSDDTQGTIYKTPTSPVDITGSLVPTGNKWKFQNFNNKVVGFQQGHSPIVWSGTGNFSAISTSGSAVPSGWGITALAAFGRVWTTDDTNTVVHYSDLLDETAWNGSVDLKSVWKGGRDEITAISAFNGQLVIFGKRSIVIYSGATSPGSMSLVENIWGVGCVSRDTVQDIGTDLFFLSRDGVRSLGRTIIQDKMPLQNLSKNVQGYLQLYVDAADMTDANSVYSRNERFYVINFPDTGRSFSFDVARPLEDGALRCTTWTDINPTAMHEALDGTVYLGQAGYIATYSGYQDDTTSYDMYYRSGWIDGGDASITKLMKRMKMVVYSGAANLLKTRWSFDFTEQERLVNKTLSGVTPAEFNVAEFNVDEFSGGAGLSTIIIPMGGHGSLFRFGFESEISVSQLAIQRAAIYMKTGRLR